MATVDKTHTSDAYLYVNRYDATHLSDVFVKTTLLPAALKTELKKTKPDIHVVAELGLPGGTKYYAAKGTQLPSIGHYQGKILQLDGLSRGTPINQNQVAAMETGLTIDDVDFEFAKIIEGSSGNDIRNSTATLKLVGPTESDTFTYFSGRIESFDQPEPLQWRLSLRPDDIPLTRKFPKKRITLFDWPNADSSALGQYVPIIYGHHSSVGISGEGQVPTLYVDNSGFRYLIAIGYIPTVGAVYVDGTATASSNYSITYPVVNGTQFTLIDFTSDQGSSSISCDCVGYEDVGDGSGNVITNPVKQMEHKLNNFIFGDYTSGNWAARGANAPIDEVLFDQAASFCDKEGYEGSSYNATQVKGVTDFNNWLKSWEFRSVWTNGGNLGIVVFDHGITQLQLDDPWIRWEQQESGFSQIYNTTSIVDRIQGQYIYNSQDGQYSFTLEVGDPVIDEDALDTLEMSHGPARLG